MVPKITDFGLSRRFGEQSRIITRNIYGTLGYLAPEYLKNGEISFKSDIYSLGIIIGKILRGNDDYPDFENWHKSQVIENPQEKRCIKIAQLCVDADEHKRPTVDEIIGMLNNESHRSRSNSVTSLEKTEGRHTKPPHVAPKERSSAEPISEARIGTEWDQESTSASSQSQPVRANKEAQYTTTQKSFSPRDESGSSSHRSFEPKQTERVGAKETAENCFGEVVDDYKLNELVRYAGKPKTQEDRARQAWRLMNEDDKRSKALRYVDVLKKVYGNGQSTLCLVYNATGDTLHHVANHDWYGYINDSKLGYPAEIGNGQWGAFHHIHRQGEPSGSMGAVVYRGKKKDGQDQDYLLGWSTPWGIWYRNKAYGEIGGVNYFQRRWDEIYVKLENADYSSHTKSGGCEIEATIDKGDSPKFTVTIKTEHSP
ncbi:receptor-like kinase LIP1 isoform X3 [Panicum virgatum]|nr:receptor-like kinase LIP1 isoform X3 [Panicum virgatum]